MMEELAGRTAVITGAASGLGRAMAERMATEGMQLVLADIEAEPLAEVADAARPTGGAAVITEQVDVSRAEDIERLADAAFDRFGAVHVLCNNAGVVKRARAWDLTVDDWQWVLGVDLWSVIHAVRAFVPRMLDRRRGRPHRQHGIDVRPAADPQPGGLQRRQVGGGGAVGGAAARLRRRGGEDRRVGAVPGLHRHPHHRERAQPPGRARRTRRRSRPWPARRRG